MTTGASRPLVATTMTNDPDTLHASVRRAVDFRGDVTVTRADGSRVEGFAFDARIEGRPDDCIRLLSEGSVDRTEVPLSAIASIECTGKDAATGRSWENWIRRYAEQKLAGEAASIESEPLD